jgi:hypothetical protein
VDNIKSAMFPINGTIDEIIKFLEGHGFKEIDDVKGRTVTDFFNSKHGKCYWLRDKEWIYFGDTSNGDISPTNGLIIIDLSRSNREYRILKNTYTCSDDYHNNTKEFLEILNKQFGF